MLMVVSVENQIICCRIEGLLEVKTSLLYPTHSEDLIRAVYCFETSHSHKIDGAYSMIDGEAQIEGYDL